MKKGCNLSMSAFNSVTTSSLPIIFNLQSRLGKLVAKENRIVNRGNRRQRVCAYTAIGRLQLKVRILQAFISTVLLSVRIPLKGLMEIKGALYSSKKPVGTWDLSSG